MAQFSSHKAEPAPAAALIELATPAMIAVDTNVVVRLLVNDDKAQAR